MHTELKIKEEPLDESEIALQQQETTFPHVSADITDMKESDQFHIVEEHDDVITVSAADMKTKDELQFIQNFQNPQISSYNQQNRPVGVNTRFGKQKCCACPLTFMDAQTMLYHLKLHRENYFFCLQNCGVGFRTLPVCEDHEKNVHKLKNAVKTRYKYNCSYCRGGFKTELQLHIHWLQRQSPCGIIKQNLVEFCNQMGNINNDNHTQRVTTFNEITKPIGKQNTMTSECTNIPVTKLRLKSIIQPSVTDNKRRQSAISNQADDDNFAIKRSKIVKNLKTQMTESPDDMLMDLHTEIHIKDEPLDEDVFNTTPPFIVPEVILKTEEDIKEEPIENDPLGDNQIADNQEEENLVEINFSNSREMKALLINSNKTMNPEFDGKIIPLISHQIGNTMPNVKLLPQKSFNHSNNDNNNIGMINKKTSLKNITNLKTLRYIPAEVGSTIIRPQTIQLRTLSSGTIDKSNTESKDIPIQLVKIMPNTQKLNFNANSNYSTTNVNNEPVFIKLPQNVIIKDAKQNGTTSNVATTPRSIASITPLNNVNITSKSNVAPIPTSILDATPTRILAATPTTILKPPSTLTIKRIVPMDCNVTPVVKSPNPNQAAPKSGVAELTEMLASKKIDSEDIKKLQDEAFRKAEELRRNNMSKQSLIAIDNLPEKKQLIASLKQQIADVSQSPKTNNTNNTPNPLFKKAAKKISCVNKNPNAPPKLYLPILTNSDPDIVEACYKHPQYIYKWECPFCLKTYGIKRCLRSHLIKSHSLTTRDLEKIKAQAKPFLGTDEDFEEAGSDQSEERQADAKAAETDLNSLTLGPQMLTADTVITKTKTSTTTPPPEPIQISSRMNKLRYTCDKCGRMCSSKKMLRDHLLANCSREPQYACTECPKKFYSESTLRCHVTIHTGELPHKCNYCEKRFRTRGQVTVHHRTHTGERPFVCQVCVQRFTHRETLISHLSRHIGMKRYKCYCCDKHFSCISALKTHREIRPDTCGKVKFNPRALGPRVRVVRGNVIFEAQPEINPYLKSEDPKVVLADLQSSQDSENGENVQNAKDVKDEENDENAQNAKNGKEENAKDEENGVD